MEEDAPLKYLVALASADTRWLFSWIGLSVARALNSARSWRSSGGYVLSTDLKVPANLGCLSAGAKLELRAGFR